MEKALFKMTKKQLIESIAHKFDIPFYRAEQAVNLILEQMTETLGNGDRIEIRGFGSFAVYYLQSRVARNPRSGKTFTTAGRYRPRFRTGKALRDRLNIETHSGSERA